MDGQLSFAPLDYAGKKKRTKRDVFLAEIAAPVLIQTRQPLAPGLARKVAAAVRSLARALFPKPDFSPDGKTLAADGSNCCKSVLTRDGYPAHTTQL